MIQRCYNPRNVRYKRYGGRGIIVCDRWKSRLQNFIDDMGLRPLGTQIDRIDNNGNYEPGNCRWATPQQNLRNTSRIVFPFMDGETEEQRKIRRARLYYDKNKSAIIAKVAAWVKRNPEKARARWLRDAKKNKAKMHAYYLRNREKILARANARYAALKNAKSRTV